MLGPADEDEEDDEEVGIGCVCAEVLLEEPTEELGLLRLLEGTPEQLAFIVFVVVLLLLLLLYMAVGLLVEEDAAAELHDDDDDDDDEVDGDGLYCGTALVCRVLLEDRLEPDDEDEDDGLFEPAEDMES
eukprot:GHVU01140628.1.p2 GENE.GHVU01140628.1~~GHVU01140628.1.p2  ORF type:complete len:130 (+),score=32.00 GHVU01140628.1:1960-2349(+)